MLIESTPHGERALDSVVEHRINLSSWVLFGTTILTYLVPLYTGDTVISSRFQQKLPSALRGIDASDLRVCSERPVYDAYRVTWRSTYRGHIKSTEKC